MTPASFSSQFWAQVQVSTAPWQRNTDFFVKLPGIANLPRIYKESVADTHLEGWICHTFYGCSWKVFARKISHRINYHSMRHTALVFNALNMLIQIFGIKFLSLVDKSNWGSLPSVKPYAKIGNERKTTNSNALCTLVISRVGSGNLDFAMISWHFIH